MFVSVFSDELGIGIEKSLATIASWKVGYVDLRGGIFRKGIHALDADELKKLKALLGEHNLQVGCLQSSLAKVHLPDAERQKTEAEKLEGLIRAADALDCRLVRSFFGWQPPKEERGRLAVQPDMLQPDQRITSPPMPDYAAPMYGSPFPAPPPKVDAG